MRQVRRDSGMIVPGFTTVLMAHGPDVRGMGRIDGGVCGTSQGT